MSEASREAVELPEGVEKCACGHPITMHGLAGCMAVPGKVRPACECREFLPDAALRAGIEEAHRQLGNDQIEDAAELVVVRQRVDSVLRAALPAILAQERERVRADVKSDEAVRAAARSLFPGTDIGPAADYPHVLDALEAALPAIQAQAKVPLEEALRELFTVANCTPTHPGLDESDLEAALQKASSVLGGKTDV